MEEDWRKSMSQVEAIRRFSSLYVRKSPKGAAASAQEVDALFRIGLAEEPLTPLQLSLSMGVSKTIVSRLVETLARKDFIKKEYSEQDRRSYSLSTTATGRLELVDLCRDYLAPVIELKRKLGDRDFEKLMELIEVAGRR